MNRQFRRGQQQLTLVIGVILLTNGLTFWLSRSVLLSWYQDAVRQLHLPDTHAVQRLLSYFVVIDQRNFLADQGLTYALLILGLVILYLGYSWVRWLWCMVWLAQGVSGLVVAYLLTQTFEQWPNLLVYGLLTSAIYVGCALALLCLPGINAYLRTIRR